ncbi:MAG: ribbon-helix-helix protein, CopG family [Deltaproteobacteria bacterium]|nr:ribbon-helix-helix protein, CopG family [Deltaproteobacteria bacterium]MBI3079273.1 ribbon-helix-helix protein, CopG family [Deltaproteobacteria bacterium]
MRTRQTMTISLPAAMIRKVEEVRKAEHRTRSELVREALRNYFFLSDRRFPEVTASPAELRAIRRGRAAYARGDYVTLDQLLHELGPPRRRARQKGA